MTEELQTPRRTILYIEDDAASRQLVLRTLHHVGYNVLVAERGLDGIDLARQTLPDLILTDIDLPDLNGREIATTLRSDARFYDTPIVALTASDRHDERELAMAAGINGYLTKPVNIEELQIHIEHYLSGGQDEIDPERLDLARERYLEEVVVRLEKRIRQLEETNKALYRLDEMKDTFIQLTAHELRTPLTLVYGYTRLLEDHPPLRDMMTQDTGIATLITGLTESIGRMHAVIDEILTMSRIMTNRIDMTIKPTNLGALVRKVLIGFDNAIRDRNLTVHFDQAEWPISMRADDDLLRIAVTNLVSNAIKYTPDEGHIYLRAEMDGQHVMFTVKDTGIGIDVAEHEKIFERFHTLNDVSLHTTSKTAFNGGGIGLGLPICRGIISAHGGRIRVESPGRDREKCPGSEFVVILPLITKAQSVPKRIKL